MTRTRKLLVPTACLAVAVLAGSAPALATSAHHASRATAARPAPLDTSSRTAVAAAYRARWKPAASTKVAISGGSVAQCRKFTTSARTQRLTKSAINFARSLAGLDPVHTVTNSHSAGAARSALMDVANTGLSHTPPASWNCYSRSGAAASARSNLALFGSSQSHFLPTVGRFIGGFLNDAPPGNTEVGHRRWVLRPEATSFGNGIAAGTVRGFRWAGDTLWIWPNSADNDHAAQPPFYGWPSKGYFPTQLEPKGRWSLSASSAAVTFGHATVHVTHDGSPVPVHVYPTANGFADNTLVWQFAHKPAHVSGSHVATYKVHVAHIHGASPYTYTIRLFNPAA